MPAEIKDMLPDIFGKDLQQTGNLANFNEPRLNYISILDTVQDFLWELAIKPYIQKYNHYKNLALSSKQSQCTLLVLIDFCPV